MAARHGTREEGRPVLITAPVATGRPGVLRWCGKAVALCGNKWRWRDMDGAAAQTAGGAWTASALRHLLGLWRHR
jgi:hypothetical protein